MNNVSDLYTIMQIIANFGFPILITLFLLFRFEVRVEQLEKKIQKLAEIIKELRRDYHA